MPTDKPLVLELHARLIVGDPDAAITFYKQALGASMSDRYTDAAGRVVHVAIRIGEKTFSLAQSVADWGLHDPLTLGGSPCLLHLETDAPDEVARRMVQAGGRVIIPVADRPYGKREGRIRDISGHLWVVSKTIKFLTSDEIAHRLASHVG